MHKALLSGLLIFALILVLTAWKSKDTYDEPYLFI